jgi:hypothetical protein
LIRRLSFLAPRVQWDSDSPRKGMVSVVRPVAFCRCLKLHAARHHQLRCTMGSTRGPRSYDAAADSSSGWSRWRFVAQACCGAAAVVAMDGWQDRRARCHADPSSSSSAGSLAAAEQLIAHVYRGLDPSHGPALSAKEEDAVDESGGSHIYGEITPPGVHAFIHWLLQRSASASTFAPHRLPESGWAFADLGSGVGRMCIHVAYMGRQWGCIRSVGVELSHTRHMAAVAAAERAREAGALQETCPLQIIEGDILKVPLDGLTVVYVASLLFEDEMLDRLAARLEAAKSVQWVATLRRLNPELLSTLQLDASIMVPMSWDEDAEVFLYCRDRQGQLPEYTSASGMSAEEAETRAFFA